MMNGRHPAGQLPDGDSGVEGVLLAKVAVGMPAGICTMESNESMPLSDHGEPPRFVHRLLAIVD